MRGSTHEFFKSVCLALRKCCFSTRLEGNGQKSVLLIFSKKYGESGSVPLGWAQVPRYLSKIPGIFRNSSLVMTGKQEFPVIFLRKIPGKFTRGQVFLFFLGFTLNIHRKSLTQEFDKVFPNRVFRIFTGICTRKSCL